MNDTFNNYDCKEMDSDKRFEQWLGECDQTSMPLPDIELEPHLLISKVRKHYMEYLIKLLTYNYENNQKLLNKNIYLPSAIWRCAKIIEMNAAKMSMVVQLYRKNLVTLIQQLKRDTQKGKLNKKLYECLRSPPNNEKKLQTNISTDFNCTCECSCNKRKKRKNNLDARISNMLQNNSKCSESDTKEITVNNMPVIANLQVESPPILSKPESECSTEKPIPVITPSNNIQQKVSTDTQDSDELMLQLEKLFQGDSQEDDIFLGGVCDNFDLTAYDEVATKENTRTNHIPLQVPEVEPVAESIKSTDNNKVTDKRDYSKNSKPHMSSKWLCEEYFLKSKLYELLDEIGDRNRKKLVRIKEVFVDLFGEDSDDEGIMSPLDETNDFIVSCKERIAPWVVKLLTPYYIKGRIKDKALFKATAKHLINLIYQCSKYPNEYEVRSFVTDFLDSHKVIRCEADFQQFKIDNLV